MWGSSWSSMDVVILFIHSFIHLSRSILCQCARSVRAVSTTEHLGLDCVAQSNSTMLSNLLVSQYKFFQAALRALLSELLDAVGSGMADGSLRA